SLLQMLAESGFVGGRIHGWTGYHTSSCTEGASITARKPEEVLKGLRVCSGSRSREPSGTGDARSRPACYRTPSLSRKSPHQVCRGNRDTKFVIASTEGVFHDRARLVPGP